MNYSTSVFLINDKVRAIACIYDEWVEGKPRPTAYTFKTMDAAIKPGDFVIVPTDTRHKMTINKVIDVDVDVDFDSSTQLKWIIGVVDKSDYEQTLKMEASAIQAIQSAEKNHKRQELRAKILADNPALKNLAIVDMNGNTVEQATTQETAAQPAPETPST